MCFSQVEIAASDHGHSSDDLSDSEGEGVAEVVADEGPDIPAEPPPVVADIPADHDWLWLTRSNRAATCSTCRQPILQAEFRAIHAPFVTAAQKHTCQWKAHLWTYYHVNADCLRSLVVLPPWRSVRPGAVRFVTDVAPLKASMKESAADRNASIEEAEALLLRQIDEAFSIVAPAGSIG